jgi:hypothetical protein
MRKSSFVWICVFLLGAVCSAAQAGAGALPGEQFVGTWTGTWEADGSPGGGFELTLEKGKEGTVAGGVSVTGEPTYKAAFNTLSFDGNKMSAKYDVPTMEGIEVVLTAVFDGASATGTWSAREKGGNEVASGGWKVAKK